MPGQYGLETGEAPVLGCPFCPDNRLLEFEPLTVEGVKGYVIPDSRPVTVNTGDDVSTFLVPMPFSALIVPFVHPLVDPDGLGYPFPDDWTGHFKRLLTLIPGLTGRSHWNTSTNSGYAAGARVPAQVIAAGRPAHPLVWVEWERDVLEESPYTSGLGLATILLQSRQGAGVLPTDQQLWGWWQAAQQDADPVATFHCRVLSYNNR